LSKHAPLTSQSSNNINLAAGWKYTARLDEAGRANDTLLVQHFKTRIQMSNPKLEAMKLFQQHEDPALIVSVYEIEQEKMRANLERLRKERLARDAGSKQP
jgi:hypothetical protein